MKQIILLVLAATAAFAGQCPANIASVTTTITQNFNGNQQPYEWTISPTALVNKPPSDATACGDAAYIAQYTSGAGCDASLTKQVADPQPTEKGCLYQFSDGGTRLMNVLLACAESAATINMDATVPVTMSGPTYKYSFTGTYAGVCGSGGGGGDGGSSSGGCGGGCAFVIIFFVGAAVYVIAMVAWNYFKLNKRGKELAPHPEFWLMIPGLIKDGAVFSFNLVTSPCRKDSGSSSTYTQV